MNYCPPRKLLQDLHQLSVRLRTPQACGANLAEGYRLRRLLNRLQTSVAQVGIHPVAPDLERLLSQSRQSLGDYTPQRKSYLALFMKIRTKGQEPHPSKR